MILFQRNILDFLSITAILKDPVRELSIRERYPIASHKSFMKRQMIELYRVRISGYRVTVMVTVLPLTLHR